MSFCQICCCGLAADSAEEAARLAVEKHPCRTWRQLADNPQTSVVAAVVLSYAWSNSDGSRGCCSSCSSSGDAAQLSWRRRYVCVSLGSGTRCLGERRGASSDEDCAERIRELFLIRDGHAEVMARRAFVAFLLYSTQFLTMCDAPHPFLTRCVYSEFDGDSQLAACKDTTRLPITGFCLREGVKVHLVSSRWMCGSLSLLAKDQTGGKLIMSVDRPVPRKLPGVTTGNNSDTAGHAEYDVVCGCAIAKHGAAPNRMPQFTHCARVKPGKGYPSRCMSCTDKVWRWSVFGLQGRRRSRLFPCPITPASILVSDLSSSAHVCAAGNSKSDGGENTSASSALEHLPTTGNCSTATRSCPIVASEDNVSASAYHSFAARLAHLPQSLQEQTLLPQFRCPHPTADTSPTGNASAADDGYSRAAWLSITAATDTASTGGVSANASRKRFRESTLCVFRWSDDAPDGGNPASWPVRSSATVNTKAGLPQGFAATRLEGVVTDVCRDELKDSVSTASKFPLSRAWMNMFVATLAQQLPRHARHPMFNVVVTQSGTQLKTYSCSLDADLRVPVEVEVEFGSEDADSGRVQQRRQRLWMGGSPKWVLAPAHTAGTSILTVPYLWT